MLDNIEFKQILKEVEKPARYVGGELNCVYKEHAKLDVALCFPDVYEVGMSHMGLQIFYELLNDMEDVYAQRVYLPWVDMIDKMQDKDIKLHSLEQKKPLGDFDLLGFNLSYEMCYTGVLKMLELSEIPLFAKDRTDSHPIVLGGGACTVNPEPMADFFDLFVIGEGEEVFAALCTLHLKHKQQKEPIDRAEFLKQAAQLPGVYVPSLYTVHYKEDGEIDYVKAKGGVPATIQRQLVADFENVRVVEKPVLPYIDTVHNRCVLEIMRGCPNGCRFCQAGYYTRPLRQRSPKSIVEQAKSIIAHTGYDEISLSSLSSGDYEQIGDLIDCLVDTFEDKRVSVSLPSLRVDSFHFAKQLMQVRRTGLTFAPEAGTQRLRDVINKNISEQEILTTVERAFLSGTSTIKLYFMIGLPTETTKDLDGIVELVKKIRACYYDLPKEKRGRGIRITVSVSNFVPKPATAFMLSLIHI